MAEQQSRQQSGEQSVEQSGWQSRSTLKMDTRAATLYNEWRQADGLFQPEAAAKKITFKDGFVRVRAQDWASIREEGQAGNTERGFEVPPWHYLEVLGSPQIKFTEA